MFGAGAAVLVGAASDFGGVADLVAVVLDLMAGAAALDASVLPAPVVLASAEAGALDAAGCAGDVSLEPAVVLDGVMLALGTSEGCAIGAEGAGVVLAAGVSFGSEENIIL